MRDTLTSVLSAAVTVFWILVAVLVAAAAYALVGSLGLPAVSPELVASVGFGLLLVVSAVAVGNFVPKRAPNRPA